MSSAGRSRGARPPLRAVSVGRRGDLSTSAAADSGWLYEPEVGRSHRRLADDPVRAHARGARRHEQEATRWFWLLHWHGCQCHLKRRADGKRQAAAGDGRPPKQGFLEGEQPVRRGGSPRAAQFVRFAFGPFAKRPSRQASVPLRSGSGLSFPVSAFRSPLPGSPPASSTAPACR
jgi:hypothetical protein